MKQPQRNLILILLVLLPLLRAKASTQTLQDWHGDTSAFVFKDGVLSIAEGAAGSSAMIYRGFSDLGDVYSFGITTLMDKPPTSRNTFKWEVLSLRSNGGEYGLYVAPTAQGQGVGLYQELPSGTDRLLTSLVLPDRLSDWQRLKILVERDKTKYRLRIITPTGRAIKGDWLTLPVEGDVIRRMIFTAKFTKNARSHLHWRLPTVSEGLEGVPDDEVHVDVQILSIKPDPSGKVTLTLDRAVDTSGAEVYCEGHNPTLRSLPQDDKSMEIDLHRPFVERQVYTISVQGLKTLDGRVVNTFSFEISTSEDTPPSDFGAWTGDLSQFVLRDGTLSVHRDALPPSAELMLRYGEEDKIRVFGMESRMERIPTSRNTFRWQVAAYENGTTREALVIKPGNDGASVQLYRETTRGEKVSKQTLLTSLAVHSPKTSWSGLKIFVLREKNGLRLKSIQRDGEERLSDLVPFDVGGRFVGEMRFVAKFTKGEKDKLHWQIPKVLQEGDMVAPPTPPSPGEPDPPSPTEVRIVSTSATAEGRITLVFSQEVDVSVAKVTCRGFVPMISAITDEPRKALITMGKELKSDHIYKLSIKGLRTISGKTVKTLSFEVRIPKVDTPSDEMVGWSGQTSHFVYRSGRLSIHPDSTGPKSTISHKYGETPTAWNFDLDCLMERLPSGQNTFEWHLFSFTDRQRKTSYFVCPDATGSAVRLCREVSDGSKSPKVSILSSIELNDPSQSWQSLHVSVSHTRKGLCLSLREGEQILSADTVKIDRQGAFDGTMKFTAKYTKNEKKKLHWRLPAVTPVEDDPAEEPTPSPDPSPEEITGWEGQLSHFDYLGGKLSIAEKSSGPKSTITHKYGDAPTAWSFALGCLMEREPSPQNSFRWDLFSYTDDERRSNSYFVRPDLSGTSVQLCIERSTGTSTSKVKILSSLDLKDPSQSWHGLDICVTHTRKGLCLSLREGEQTLFADTVRIDRQGAFDGTIKFTAKYTKNEKKKLHWRLPAVTPVEDDPAEEPTPSPPPAEEKTLYISEIMASAPEDGPFEGFKYLELYNPHETEVSLHTFVLRYKNTSYTLPEVTVAPRSYVTLFDEDNPPAETLPHSVGMGKFPALSGTFVLQLIGVDSRKVVDRVKFGHRLYGYGFEKGRASVERLSFSGQDDRWRRSDDPRGGTPSEPTKMKRPLPVVSGTVIINELLLSPPSTGEKYIELHNTSDKPIRLQDLYLRYRNKPEGDPTEWRLVTSEHLIPAHGYIVLTPYPDALVRLYRDVPTDVLIERIDFPSLSPTYTEISLHAYATDEVVDRVVYRRQHLGSSTKDRNGFALERRLPTLDGTKESSWRRALKESNGGTPGRVNSVYDLPALSEEEEEVGDLWPDDPELDYTQLERYARRYADRLVMEVFSLLGQPLVSQRGTDCLQFIDDFRQSRLSWDTRLYIISIRIRGSDKQHDLHYKGKWLYRGF